MNNIEINPAEGLRQVGYSELVCRYSLDVIPHRRQKVTDNLLGNQRFCPMIRRTDNLSNYIDLQLDKKGMEVVESYSEEILLRAVISVKDQK